MSSIRNTVVVAIMQVGVIVASVLAAGILHRVWMSRDWTLPVPAALLYDSGVGALLIPLVWATAAAVLHVRAGVSEDGRALMFWLGILILISLIIFSVYADVAPWLVFLQNAGNGDDIGA